MKQKMKQVLKDVEKVKNADKIVEGFILKFNQLNDAYVKQASDLLMSIYDIRKLQNKDYTITDLENEKGLEIHRTKIRPLLRFKNLSENIQDTFQKEKISPSTIFLLANLPVRLRDDENQKKIIEKIQSGKLSNADLIGTEGLMKVYNTIGDTEGRMTFEEELLLYGAYQIISVIKYLEKHQDIYRRNPQWINKLKDNLRTFNHKIKEMFG
jgi:hypothetical protein